jgi:hypothetical protein
MASAPLALPGSSMLLVTGSLESVLSLQPDWLKQRTSEAARWADAMLSKITVIQIDRERLRRGEPSAQLRSDALDPAVFGAASFRDGRGNIPTQEAVDALVTRRTELLQSHAKLSPLTNVHTGKLLLFTPQDSLSDEAATVASDGFFDVDNVPAWDTWLYFDGHTLLSWVPPQLISKIQLGIEVNPESCIRWAE